MTSKLEIVRVALLGTCVALLAAILIVLTTGMQADREDATALRTLLLEPRYEYRVLEIAADKKSRTGEEALAATSANIDEKELAKLGSQGWEVVTTYLETETSYPNLGDSKYVTGLQTNVRPQRLVVILRHRLG